MISSHTQHTSQLSACKMCLSAKTVGELKSHHQGYSEHLRFSTFAACNLHWHPTSALPVGVCWILAWTRCRQTRMRAGLSVHAWKSLRAWTSRHQQRGEDAGKAAAGRRWLAHLQSWQRVWCSWLQPPPFSWNWLLTLVGLSLTGEFDAQFLWHCPH